MIHDKYFSFTDGPKRPLRGLGRVAGTVKPLTPEAEQIRQEVIEELKERAGQGSARPTEHDSGAWTRVKKRRNFNDSGCGQRWASNHCNNGPLATVICPTFTHALAPVLCRTGLVRKLRRQALARLINISKPQRYLAEGH
jgi:hypothetical protein